MGKKKDKIRRRQAYINMLKKETPTEDDRQHWMLICKRDPERMKPKDRNDLQPQRPDPYNTKQKRNVNHFRRGYGRPYRDSDSYYPEEWE